MISETWEIWLILQFQKLDGITPVMEVFTWLGYPQAYMIIIAVIYWAFDRKIGLRLAIFLPLAASVNSILKQAIHAPRPYWTDSNITAIHPDTGFGMPSGHAQSATVWLLAAAFLKKWWFWILTILLTAGVGISRAYLGVHFPSQIVLGWLIGIIMIICFIRFETDLVSWLGRLNLTRQLLFVLGCTILILSLGYIFIAFLNCWTMPVDWIQNASDYRSIDQEELITYGMKSVAGNAGGFLGGAMGAILMQRAGNFHVVGAWWIRLLRIITGLICIAALFVGIQSLSPDKAEPAFQSTWRFLGFFLISFSAIFLLPMMFKKMKLLQ